MLAANLKIAADIKIALVTTSGKTRKTFFGLGGTAPKVLSRFPSDGCKASSYT